MPSIHRDNRGKTPYWIGAFTNEAGQRLKRSTGTTDRREAQRIVETWQQAADLARSGRLTETRAREVVNEMLARLGKKKIYAPTTKQYLEDWLKRERGTTSESVCRKKEHVVRLFIESLRGRERLPVEDISEADLVTFRDGLISEGRHPRTVNMMLTGLLAKAFRDGMKAGVIRLNPAATLKNIRVGAPMEKGVFSADQIRRLISVADPDWKGLILAGFYTGGRLSDLVNLQWSSVDLAKRSITFRQRKTDGLVKIPMHPDLEEHFLSLPRHDGDEDPVFPTLYGKPSGGSYGLSVGFTKVMSAAGIISAQLRSKGEGVGRSVSALSFHSLRHSFNSVLLNAGVPQELRMRLTGHSSEAMNTLYSHHELETIRVAIEHLPRL
ncbi:MAG TPA: site-specific integrase [Chthoniobacterales bacterium]